MVGCVLALGCGGESPPAPTPDPVPTPGPTEVALSGFVRDAFTDVPLANARVETLDPPSGKLTGIFVLTDASGRYSFPGISGSQSIRASKDGYEGQYQRIHLVLTSTATFHLMPVSGKPPRETIVPGETKTGAVSFSDPKCGGLFWTLPCKRFVLILSEGMTLKARLTWSGSSDIDLELWRDDTEVVKSFICQACIGGPSEEEFTRFIPAGEYELRATLFDGAGSPFTLTVTRVN